MTTSCLALLKRELMIIFEAFIKLKMKLFIRFRPKNNNYSNDDIIIQARNVVKDRKEQGWSRQDFFAEFMQVRERVLKQIREHYEQN